MKRLVLICLIVCQTALFGSHCSSRESVPFANLSTQQDLSQASSGIAVGEAITFETVNSLNNRRYFDTHLAPVNGSIIIKKDGVYEVAFTVVAFALFRDLIGLHPTPSWGVAPQIIRNTVPMPILAGQVFATSGVVVVPTSPQPIASTYTSTLTGIAIMSLKKGDTLRLINASNDSDDELFLTSFPASSDDLIIPASNSASITITVIGA